MSLRLLTSVALSAAFVSLPSASRGQGGVSTDPVLERMWTLGMDSSHTWDLAQTFFDSIGPRLTGTPQGTRGERLGDEDVPRVGHRRRAASSTARGAAGGAAIQPHRPRQAARPHARSDDPRRQPGHRRQERHRHDDHSADGRRTATNS